METVLYGNSGDASGWPRIGGPELAPNCGWPRIAYFVGRGFVTIGPPPFEGVLVGEGLMGATGVMRQGCRMTLRKLPSWGTLKYRPNRRCRSNVLTTIPAKLIGWSISNAFHTFVAALSVPGMMHMYWVRSRATVTIKRPSSALEITS